MARGYPLAFSRRRMTTPSWSGWIRCHKSVMDARPLLWVRSATIGVHSRPNNGVEEKLQAAENASEKCRILTMRDRDLMGQIAAPEPTLAVPATSLKRRPFSGDRALEYLHCLKIYFPHSRLYWALGFAYQLSGMDRAAARPGCTIAKPYHISQASGNKFYNDLVNATTSWAESRRLAKTAL